MHVVESLKRVGAVTLLCLSIAAVSGCAHMPDKGANTEQSAGNDSLEPLNRVIFGINRVVDALVLKPITIVYQAIMPDKGQEMVSNAVDNIYSPVVLGNSLLQGDIQNSFATFWRFAINTTFGIGGLFDVASEIPLKNRTTDLGQTLAIYGAEPGDYLVLPLLGPSDVRDAFGRVGDIAMNPITWGDRGTSYVVAGVTISDIRSRNSKVIDDIYDNSLDPYATFRSAFLQKRASDVKRAKAARDKSIAATAAAGAQ